DGGRALAIAVIGCGRMGHAVEQVARNRGHRIVARIDPRGGEGITARELDASTVAGADVAIEFTTPEAAPENLRRLIDLGVCVVSGTTGWTDGRLDAMRERARERETGFVWAPNFALGMQAMFRITAHAAGLLGRLGGFAPFLVEEHHDAKKDAPSGTAARLAEILVEATPGKARWGVAPQREPVPADMLSVAWIRAGSIPGTHRCGWDGAAETIELVHRARDRSVFAVGAVTVAEWLAADPGVFTLDELIDRRLGLHDKGESR
ncbi:MAG: 4-hydroxy-tetrahydrodipicolinate reductase, partial [Acidobacteria bacterium]